MQTQAKELCGKEIVIHHDLYPEYTIFVYDAVMTVAYGLHAVLKSKPDATFAYPNRCGVSSRTKEERTLLYQNILNVTFDGMSGKVSFKPGVGDRVPAKMEIVNIYVSPVSPFHKQNGAIIDIGDSEFFNSTNYRFEIDSVPRWPGGGTAVPTDRSDSEEEYLALYMTLTLLWMSIAFIFGAMLERWQIHRLPESGAVVVFGIIAGVLIRFMGSEVSSVGGVAGTQSEDGGVRPEIVHADALADHHLRVGLQHEDQGHFLQEHRNHSHLRHLRIALLRDRHRRGAQRTVLAQALRPD